MRTSRKKTVRRYTYTGLGYPIKLRNVQMRRLKNYRWKGSRRQRRTRPLWVLELDLDAIMRAETVRLAEKRKVRELSMPEHRFLRQYLMTFGGEIT